MLKALDLLPGWVYAVAIAALLLFVGGEFYSHNQTRTTLLKERAAWAQSLAKAEQTAREQSERYRALEQGLTDAQLLHAEETAGLLDALGTARAAADAAAGGMRNATAAAVARGRAQCAASTAAGVRPSTDDPIGVLALVLGRADARADLLADLADRRYVAGRACEREYDTARKALKDADPR